MLNNRSSAGRRIFAACLLTARQYGEVVLPDASTGHGPGTLARKLSRCKEGMARVFAVMVQGLIEAGVSRYKFDRSQEFIKVQNYK